MSSPLTRSSPHIVLDGFVRVFDPALPIYQHGERPDGVEDTALTAFLTAAVDEVLSGSLTPIACTDCGDRRTVLVSGPNAKIPMPRFLCLGCGKNFSRATGTALERMARKDVVYGFLPLLSQQAPRRIAMERLGLSRPTARAWTAKFRAWLLKLDPSGYWEAKVRLGIKPPAPELTCPSCNHHGEARFGGFSQARGGKAAGARMYKCGACERTFLADAAPRETTLPAYVEVLTYNAAMPSVEARPVLPGPRRLHGQAPRPRKRPTLALLPPIPPPMRQFDPSAPIHDWGQGRLDTEDKALTAFVMDALDGILSPSTDPPCCPHCGDWNTTRAGHLGYGPALPLFECHDCKKRFSRTVGTPLHQLTAYDKIGAFVPFLSQQLSSKAAGKALGIGRVTVSEWTMKFRTWLLKLDPSGHWEAKVRLGVHPPPPEAHCPSCGHDGPVKFFGFLKATADKPPRRRVMCNVCSRTFGLPAPGPDRDLRR